MLKFLATRTECRGAKKSKHTMQTSQFFSLKHLALDHLTLKHLTLKHFFLLASLLLFTACHPNSRALTFQSLTVTPPTGHGQFTLSVSYTPGAQDDSIVCHFKVKEDEFARANVIGQITVRGQEKPVSQSTELEFSLSSPGNYLVDCSAISNGEQVAADLSVT